MVPRRNLLIQVSSWEVNIRNKTVCNIISKFLELLGFDDLTGFKSDLEKECHDIDEPRLWYGRRIGFKDDGFEEKTALMTATMLVSEVVLNYILETSCCCCGLCYFN